VHAELSGRNSNPATAGVLTAVVTQGGRTVWLAGHTATQDDEGRDISYNFEAQVRQVFRDLDHTLRRAGGTLVDMVTMTVFILDSRLGTRFTEMRHETFPDGKYPASALITVSSFARPGLSSRFKALP